MKSQEEIIKEIREVTKWAMREYRYREGFKKIERLSKKLENLTSEILYKLGLLGDHIALKEGDSKKKKAWEEKALKLYDKSLRKDPDYVNSIWGKGRVYWHRGNFKEALNYAKKAYREEKKRNMRGGALNVGLIYENMGKYKLAEKWYLRGVADCKPKQAAIYANLVNMYYNLNKIDEAQKYAKKMSSLLKKETREYRSSKTGKYLEGIINKVFK